MSQLGQEHQKDLLRQYRLYYLWILKDQWDHQLHQWDLEHLWDRQQDLWDR
jgi:hypothetical protein